MVKIKDKKIKLSKYKKELLNSEPKFEPAAYKSKEESLNKSSLGATITASSVDEAISMLSSYAKDNLKEDIKNVSWRSSPPIIKTVSQKAKEKMEEERKAMEEEKKKTLENLFNAEDSRSEVKDNAPIADKIHYPDRGEPLDKVDLIKLEARLMTDQDILHQKFCILESKLSDAFRDCLQSKRVYDNIKNQLVELHKSAAKINGGDDKSLETQALLETFNSNLWPQ